MATGEQPFAADTPADGISRTLTLEPKPPSAYNSSLSEAFDSMVAALIEKNPKMRLGSSLDVALALDKMRKATGEFSRARAPFIKRRIRPLILAIAGVVILAVGFTLLRPWRFIAQLRPPPYDLAVLPLLDPSQEAHFNDSARELQRQFHELGSPARIFPPDQIDQLYNQFGLLKPTRPSQEVIQELRKKAAYILLWEINRREETPMLMVDVLSTETGDIAQTLQYPMPEEMNLQTLLKEKLVRELEAHLFSLRKTRISYPKGYEHLRPSPITWSQEAARLFVDAYNFFINGKEWEAYLQVNRAIAIDSDFAQAYYLRGRLTALLEMPYTGNVLTLPNIERALELQNRLESWQVAQLKNVYQFITQGSGPTIQPLDGTLISSLGPKLQALIKGATLLFRGEEKALLDFSLDYFSREVDPCALWMDGIGMVLNLGYSSEQISAALEPLVDVHSQHPLPHMILGIMLIEHPEAVERAETELSRARELDGGRWRPWLAWATGKMQYYAGRYDRAAEILLEALETATPKARFAPGTSLEEMAKITDKMGRVDPRVFSFLAMTYRRMERYTEAQQAIDSYREIFPENPWIDYENGMLFLDLKEHESALDAFTIIINKDPNYRFSYFWRGKALYDMGKTEAALADLEHFVEIMGSELLDHPRVQEAQTLISLIQK